MNIPRNVRGLVIGLGGVVLGVILFAVFSNGDSSTTSSSVLSAATTVVPDTIARPTTTSSSPATTTTLPTRGLGLVPGWTVGRPWGETVGVTMFRGNPTRSFYGRGAPQTAPSQRWTYPQSAMCRSSSSGGETKLWCGMGWTGQPALWERPDGKTELIFGAYDGAVHFVDAATGLDLRAPLQTNDIIKGSVTIDPDGFPLLYFGSRDNLFRIVALDRDQPEVIWSMHADDVAGIWNDDWDSNPVVVDDILYEGGENGWFFAVRLGRGYDSNGQVTVSPEFLLKMPGYDSELLSKSGRNVSIESSTLVYGDRVYFSNSGGRIVGLDVSDIRSGNAEIVFDFYAGGDIDATMVADEQGMLYVSIEHEPSQMNAGEKARNKEVGQLIKLNPYVSEPLVWGVDLTSGTADSGSWATPVVHQGVVYVNTHQGKLIAVSAETGESLWSDEVGWHSWSSPVVVDQTLITATCLGDVRAYSVADPTRPVPLWSVSLGEACLEATPVVWDGAIYVGSRDGFFHALD